LIENQKQKVVYKINVFLVLIAHVLLL